MKIINQYKGLLSESIMDIEVKRVKDYLDDNYEPTEDTFEVGGEFIKKKLIIKLNSEERITPNELLTYLKKKFKDLEPDFIKQVIIEWGKKTIKADNLLSKNISKIKKDAK